MQPDKRPIWAVPPQYTGSPEVPAPGAAEDDTPIDYSKGPDRSVVFGEDEDEDAGLPPVTEEVAE